VFKGADETVAKGPVATPGSDGAAAVATIVLFFRSNLFKRAETAIAATESVEGAEFFCLIVL
jgi:hypothetical protein